MRGLCSTVSEVSHTSGGYLQALLVGLVDSRQDLRSMAEPSTQELQEI